MVVLWLSLPHFLQTTLEEILAELDGELSSITVEKANPWSIEISDLEGTAWEGDFSLQMLNLRYDPFSLAEGRVHALSLTSPQISLPCSALEAFLDSNDSSEQDPLVLQEHAQALLLNPPLQHLRLRDVGVTILSQDLNLSTTLGLEGDFHTGLAQLRMDGNTSGFSWLGDLTMIQEGNDFFLGASLHFPDLSKLFPLVDSLDSITPEPMNLDLHDWIQIEQGSAKGQWTGRVEEDGIMDQFMDFNATDMVLQFMGMTLEVPQAILF